MRTLFFILALLSGTSASGGAWLKEQGTGFLSFSGTLEESGKTTGSLFVEYGLRPKLTLGLKADMIGNVSSSTTGSAYIFVRKPIATGKRSFKLAYELGLGAAIRDDTMGLVRVGFNYGRGTKVRNKPGWVSIDSALEWTDDNSLTVKLDGTVGLTLSNRLKAMFQIYFDHYDGEATTTFAPSIIWRPTARARHDLQLGFEAKDGRLGLKLGLWRDF